MRAMLQNLRQEQLCRLEGLSRASIPKLGIRQHIWSDGRASAAASGMARGPGGSTTSRLPPRAAG